MVTSDFHMPRSRAIFETCFSLAGAALWDDPDRCRSPGFRLHPCNPSPAHADVVDAKTVLSRTVFNMMPAAHGSMQSGGQHFQHSCLHR